MQRLAPLHLYFYIYHKIFYKKIIFMNIALIGYGKMGKEIEKIAIARNHKITLIIDINNIADLNIENLSKADVAIEFTTPHTAIDNYLKCFEAGIPVVSGTTGWLQRYDEVITLCKKYNSAFFYASNFSLGVNIFFKLNAYLARIMNKYDNYNVEIEEIHHTQKLDAPSGTAITLANDIIKNITRKQKWELNTEDKINNLNIRAIRQDAIPGIHTIKYESEVDFIQITHSAKNRQGLALGAVMAAEFIKNKKGIFSMNDLLKFD